MVNANDIIIDHTIHRGITILFPMFVYYLLDSSQLQSLSKEDTATAIQLSAFTSLLLLLKLMGCSELYILFLPSLPVPSLVHNNIIRGGG